MGIHAYCADSDAWVRELIAMCSRPHAFAMQQLLVHMHYDMHAATHQQHMSITLQHSAMLDVAPNQPSQAGKIVQVD